MSSSLSSIMSALPCVVQVGFSGSRNLYDRAGLAQADFARIDAEIEEILRVALLDLRRELGLSRAHFLAGVSQIAVGGDTLFTRCCGPEGRAGLAMQRVMLPQPIDAYLTAEGSSGPDFSPAERETARQLLRRPSIVHIQSVSSADSRAERFTDALHAILAASDVGVCLLRAGVVGRPGGSVDFIEFARKAHKPVRLIEIAVVDGRVQPKHSWVERASFALPCLPHFADHISAPAEWVSEQLPSAVDFCATLKAHFSPQAKGARERFERMARIVLRTHLGATACAALAIVTSLAFGSEAGLPLAGLLTVELGLLVWGRLTHDALHHGGHGAPTVRAWATSRLTAEISRSVSAIGQTHLYLAHLSILRILPVKGLDRLVDTIRWLHLRATVVQRDRPYQKMVADYLGERVDDQIGYLHQKSEEARRELQHCHRRFLLWWWLGLSASALKLAEIVSEHFLALPTSAHLATTAAAALFGVAAIVFPMLAVAALSWAAALDFEARASEFKEIHDFLERQRPLFEQVSSTREVRRLMIETETTLLGEVAQWYVRRAYSSVA